MEKIKMASISLSITVFQSCSLNHSKNTYWWVNEQNEQEISINESIRFAIEYNREGKFNNSQDEWIKSVKKINFEQQEKRTEN